VPLILIVKRLFDPRSIWSSWRFPLPAGPASSQCSTINIDVRSTVFNPSLPRRDPDQCPSSCKNKWQKIRHERDRAFEFQRRRSLHCPSPQGAIQASARRSYPRSIRLAAVKRVRKRSTYQAKGRTRRPNRAINFTSHRKPRAKPDTARPLLHARIRLPSQKGAVSFRRQLE